MQQLLGEYECKLDAKGRMRLPSALLRQLSAQGEHVFVVNRGIENCLQLYTLVEWERISAEVNALDPYVKKNRLFIRRFHRGATRVSPDAQDRIMLPQRLREYAGIEKEAVVFAYGGNIEVWSKDRYDAMYDEEPEDFAELAEDVMKQARERDADGGGVETVILT